jgi:hypothetical protein
MGRPTKIVYLALLSCFSILSTTKAGVSIIGGLSHEKKARPGEIYKGAVLVKNNSTEPEEVKVYQTDYQFFFDGNNNYGPPGKSERSNANWLSFNPHRLTIPPDDVLTVNYTTKVPDDPNLVGTYWSMLMIEGVPKSSQESSQAEKGKAKIGITQIVRYGIQMITNIGDTGERNLKFLQTKLLREAEGRFLQVDIENTGQRWLRSSLWVELYDESGGYIGKFDGGGKHTYPGTSVRYKVDLTGVPQGAYKALVVADCGGDDIFGANYDFKFEK